MGRIMNSPELATVSFAACNSARVLAYIPQIVVTRDRSGAPGVSCFKWAGFAAANFSTVACALLVAPNLIMAVVFGQVRRQPPPLLRLPSPIPICLGHCMILRT